MTFLSDCYLAGPELIVKLLERGNLLIHSRFDGGGAVNAMKDDLGSHRNLAFCCSELVGKKDRKKKFFSAIPNQSVSAFPAVVGVTFIATCPKSQGR